MTDCLPICQYNCANATFSDFFYNNFAKYVGKINALKAFKKIYFLFLEAIYSPDLIRFVHFF